MSAGYVVMQQKKSCSREKQDHFALVFVGTKTSAILGFCLVAFRCGRETSSDRFFFTLFRCFLTKFCWMPLTQPDQQMSLWWPVSWLCLFYLDAVPSTPSGTWSLDQEFISWDKILEQMVPPPKEKTQNLKIAIKVRGNENYNISKTHHFWYRMLNFWLVNTQFYLNPIFKSPSFCNRPGSPLDLWTFSRWTAWNDFIAWWSEKLRNGVELGGHHKHNTGDFFFVKW